jgi:hypothetical protein
MRVHLNIKKEFGDTFQQKRRAAHKSHDFTIIKDLAVKKK